MCKPFIKWVGGKRQLADELQKRLPSSYNRYFEPFVGGGALFFALKPEKAFIADLNSELINVYKIVRDYVEELIKELSKYKNTKTCYYKTRDMDRKPDYHRLPALQKAARFIYLNKTCYNGLYRVNSKGQFNVPFGKYKNPKICDAENLRACSQALQKTEIVNADFSIVLDFAKPKDFVYFDPPYVPLNATSNFTAYTQNGFDVDMQFRLKEVCDKLTDKGVLWMLSNSYTEFVLNLYKEYNIHTVYANRAVNCKSNGRGKIKEVIVRNY